MFISQMTSQELYAEYQQDLDEIDKFNERLVDSDMVSRLMKRNSKAGRFHIERIHTTKRHNQYLMAMQFAKVSGVDWKWVVYAVGLMDTSKGKFAIVFYDDCKIGMVMQAHFFSQYKKRFYEVCDWKARLAFNNAVTQTDVIALFVRRNTNTIWLKTDTLYKTEHIFAPIRDGVALLQWNGKTLQANTFITEGMYSKKQLEMIEQAKYAESLNKESEQILKCIWDELMQGSKEKL